MPIFEFRCLECGHLFEMIFTNSQEQLSAECPECHSDSFERVLSRTNFLMGTGPGGKQPKITTKSCGSGNSCMTLDLPGPSR